MAAEETLTLWDELHALPKHDLRYPSEHVVRFLSGLNHRPGRMAVDIGCGHGRHMRLLEDFGYVAMGVDATAMPGVVQGRMTDLPLVDDTFDVALAYGVFYYGPRQSHLTAIGEMHRVLKPGGVGLIKTRSTMDSRYQTGRVLDRYTRRMTCGDEDGMVLNFLTKANVRADYMCFSEVVFELTETTRDGMGWKDSDWLIRVVK